MSEVETFTFLENPEDYDELVLECKRQDRIGMNRFWESVSEAFSKGYVYAFPSQIHKQPTFYPSPKVTLYRPKVDLSYVGEIPTVEDLREVTPTPPQVEQPQEQPQVEEDKGSLVDKVKDVFTSKTPIEKELSSCSTFADLEAFATRYGLDLPVSSNGSVDRRPPVIRKHLKDIITGEDFINSIQ